MSSRHAHYLNAFDDWASLADSDPQAFENLRLTLIDELIENAPANRRHRLRCLQWRIEQERAKSSTPLGACVRLTRMMWDKVTAPGGLLENLQDLRSADRETGSRRSGAVVIPFRRRQR